MDRRLKERVVGAVLLVIAGIIFIPWLLDGRGPAHSVSQPLELPAAGDDGAMKTKRIVLNAGQRSAPDVPVVNETPDGSTPRVKLPTPRKQSAATPKQEPVEDGRDQSSVPSTPPPAVATTPVSEPAPAAVSAQSKSPSGTTPRAISVSVADPTRGWAVQVGSFSSQGNAQRLAKQLTGLNYKAFVSRKVIGDNVMYRVRVGPTPNRDSAAALAARLKADKQPVRIVEHPG